MIRQLIAIYQDPEYNTLGSRGIRGRAKKVKDDEEDVEVCLSEGGPGLDYLTHLLTSLPGSSTQGDTCQASSRAGCRQ